MSDIFEFFFFFFFLFLFIFSDTNFPECDTEKQEIGKRSIVRQSHRTLQTITCLI